MKFLQNKSGATAIEYGLIAAFIAVVIITAIGAVGQQLLVLLNSVGAGFAGA